VLVIQPETPFGDEALDEILLSNSPLIAVVAQLRFPPVTSIANEGFIGRFQEALRSDYPVLRPEREVGMVLTPSGIGAGGDSGQVWRFSDKVDTWRVSLAPSYVALDTTAYLDRPDFVARLRAVLEALASAIGPATFDRFGLRYADRVELREPEGADALDVLVRPEVRGIATTPLGPHGELVHSVADSEFRVADAVLHGRWGVVAANARLDRFHGDPVACPSWLLDLDMYAEGPTDFDVEGVVALAGTFADRIYRFFRWAVEPELLRRCGAAI
jgi:uncharacterized protein (TIGR04255 family)